jgi:hypothetical protein
VRQSSHDALFHQGQARQVEPQHEMLRAEGVDMTSIPATCLEVAKDGEFLGIFLDIFAVLLTLEAVVFLCVALSGGRKEPT